jgi:cell wall-associated NlpC family hydrolase
MYLAGHCLLRKGREVEMPDTLENSVAANAEAILLSVAHTVYQHDTYVDVATGTYDMDCSGYVGYVLAQLAPRHYQAIPPDRAAGRPLAFDFYDRFSELPPQGADGWWPVPALADVNRGDIVAWKSELIEPHSNTGHVFIVAGEPEFFDDGVISVLVYDSSNIRHYDDTRGQGGTSPATGVGRGRIHFRSGSAGWEFQFGPGDSYHECPIAAGRIQPLTPLTAAVGGDDDHG